MSKRWLWIGLLALGMGRVDTADAQPYDGWTRLVNAAWSDLKGTGQGECIDVPRESKAVGTAVGTHPCHNGANQHFRLLDKDLQDSRIAVYTGADERCLSDAGGKIVLARCENAPRWRTGPLIATTDHRSCVRIQDNGDLGVAPCNPLHPDPRAVFGSNWHMSTLATPYGRVLALINEHRFDCADVQGESKAPGASMVHWGCKGSQNQRVSVRGVTREVYLTVYEQGEMLCLSNIPNPGNPRATEAVPCNRWDTRQAWRVEADVFPAGGYRLVNARTGRCLDAYADDKWIGSLACTRNATQSWLFAQG